MRTVEQVSRSQRPNEACATDSETDMAVAAWTRQKPTRLRQAADRAQAAGPRGAAVARPSLSPPLGTRAAASVGVGLRRTGVVRCTDNPGGCRLRQGPYHAQRRADAARRLAGRISRVR